MCHSRLILSAAARPAGNRPQRAKQKVPARLTMGGDTRTRSGRVAALKGIGKTTRFEGVPPFGSCVAYRPWYRNTESVPTAAPAAAVAAATATPTFGLRTGFVDG
jgi:hypothetical protein